MREPLSLMEQHDKPNQEKRHTFELQFKDKKCGTPKLQAEERMAMEEVSEDVRRELEMEMKTGRRYPTEKERRNLPQEVKEEIERALNEEHSGRN